MVLYIDHSLYYLQLLLYQIYNHDNMFFYLVGSACKCFKNNYELL